MKAAAVFSDNMVLQRNRNIRVFGTCSKNEKIITVRIPELESFARAVVKDGRWEAVLPPRKEYSSCTLEISCGAVKKIFKNVAIGEVWLAGGQSNMEFELQHERKGAAALASCYSENVRFYYTPKCSMLGDELEQAEKESCWRTPSPDNAKAWSAVGYYFARELSRRLGVTVGIIGCNWGGSSASAWISRDYLSCDKRLSPYLDEYDEAIKGKSDEEMIAEYDEYSTYQWAWEQRMIKFCAENPKAKWDEVLKNCGENRYPRSSQHKEPHAPLRSP